MYAIQFIDGGESKRDKVLTYLRERVKKHGKFTAVFSATEVKKLPAIRVSRVRLTKSKPYCGQHPGECEVNPFLGPQPKKIGRWLEWDDWIQFHDLINKSLNRFRANANVWSEPMDCVGKMHIRKGKQSRIKWGWTEYRNKWGTRIQTWNNGTDDQFGPPVGNRKERNIL